MNDELNKLLNTFVNDFCESAWNKLQKDGLKGVGVTGSYARGDYSPQYPDINFAVFADTITPELLIGIGNILSELNTKLSPQLNLRPDYHPERFVYPWGKGEGKQDIFFKIALFPISEKDSAMPFGRPGFVIEGHKLSAKILKGKNYFDDAKISSSNQEVLNGAVHVLGTWSRQILQAPISYNLAVENELFFAESLSWGKIAIMNYAWIQGIKNGLDYSRSEDRLTIFEKVHHKESLRTFIDVPQTEKDMINLVLDARLNYKQWKDDRKISEGLFFASCHLLNFFLLETKRLIPNKEGSK